MIKYQTRKKSDLKSKIYTNFTLEDFLKNEYI